MANIKSQIKRNRQNEKHRRSNQQAIAKLRTMMKKCEQAFIKGDPSSTDKVRELVSYIDSCVNKKIIHKNSAGKKKSKVMSLSKKKHN